MNENKTMIYEDLPLIIDASILAELFHISKGSAYNIMRRKDFPSFKIGNLWFVERNKLVDWIDKHEGRRY